MAQRSFLEKYNMFDARWDYVMPNQNTGKSDDTRALAALELRSQGLTNTQIARELGYARGSSVRKLFARVDRDLAASEHDDA